MSKIILASSSRYRQELLKRLSIKFTSISPNIDENKHAHETFEQLARRLSNDKAEIVSANNPSAFVIGSDQTAEYDNKEVKKPLSFEKAFLQLKQYSGKTLNFYTGICIKNKQKNISVDDVVKFSVTYKNLTDEQIENYLSLEDPTKCVGSIKSEGLGITLLEEIVCNDPTAVIGLPLIKLSKFLKEFEVL